MTDRRGKFVPPSITETAFNCPHCGALAKQTWFELAAAPLERDALPLRNVSRKIDSSELDEMEEGKREVFKRAAQRMEAGRPFIRSVAGGRYLYSDIYNANVAVCFNCSEISIWVGVSLVWPASNGAPLPNPDLPDEIRRDFEEAGQILNLSPRGSAALLRLAIQKLCKEVGEKGRNIDDDIASLVRKGLDTRLQQALDVVRVIGNQAVHPGQIDLRDDYETAKSLFDLVNLIADRLITQPKKVTEMYNRLPEGALKAIERRDNK